MTKKKVILSGLCKTINDIEFYFDLDIKEDKTYHLDINGKFKSIYEVDKIFKMMKFYFKDYRITSDNYHLYDDVIFHHEF